MKKRIIISIHVDGYYGLTNGVPRVLKLLKKYNLKANFFVSMGRESSILDILKLRGISGKNKSRIKIQERYTFFQKICMLLLNRKIGSGHCKLLKEIEKEGHEVNPHCWSHLRWSKNFENLNIDNEFKKMCRAYFSCLNHFPTGFVPPLWKWDKRVLNSLEKNNFESLCVISKEKKPYFNGKILLFPLSLDSTPEELFSQGYSEREIIESYKKELKKNYVHFYFHADFEGIKGIEIFENILNLIKNKRAYTCKEIYTEMNQKRK